MIMLACEIERDSLMMLTVGRVHLLTLMAVQCSRFNECVLGTQYITDTSSHFPTAGMCAFSAFKFVFSSTSVALITKFNMGNVASALIFVSSGIPVV